MKNTNGLMAAVAGIVILVGMSSVLAQDWPQWRGPNRDDKLNGFAAPQSWPKELKQKWKVTVGVGDSSPALVGDKLYAFGRQEANEVISCIDAVSGKVLWQEIYPAQFVVTGPSSRHPGTRSSPIVVEGKLCVLGVGGILSCLDAATGKVLWRKQSAADYLDTAYQFESSMSPMVVHGMCIVYVGGKGQGSLIAFDLASGQAKWKYTGDAPAPSSPVVATIEGTRQIVTINEKEVIGVSLADQTLLWQVPFKARPVNTTTPVIDGQTVYVTGQGMGTLAIKVAKKDGKFTAEPMWTNSDTQAGSTFTTPVLRDGLLFGFAATKLNCLDAKTGRVLWADTANRGQGAAIVDAGSCLIALTVNGELSVYLPSDKQYTELAHYKVGDPEIWAHPVIAGKSIFIRDKESVTLWTIP
ncbi:MAG: PQQ-like beta-propeller repeat protein [Phycisphaerae bacterium]|nr:PQQ-like beta-propeller repeat protein [Phycisphaerae bacterium]